MCMYSVCVCVEISHTVSVCYIYLIVILLFPFDDLAYVGSLPGMVVTRGIVLPPPPPNCIASGGTA